MKVSLKNYELIAFGSVIIPSQESIVFELEDLVIEFHFHDDKETQGAVVKTEISDEKHGVLRFTNFNNSLGIGNTKPLEIGTYHGKKLLLNYRIYTLTPESGKLVHYTWLAGDING